MGASASANAALKLSYPAKVLLLGMLYLAIARFSLRLAIPPGYATAMWPPAGIAVAALVLLGPRAWPGIWIGAALANLYVEDSAVSAVLIATGNTLEALVAAYLIKRSAGTPARFEKVEQVLKFILSAPAASAVAATVALLPITLGRGLSHAEALREWWTWWQGDVDGILIVTPLILSWAAKDSSGRVAGKGGEAVLFAILLCATALAMSSDGASAFVPFSLTFVTLPFVIWAALRLGQREMTTAIAAVCAVAVWYVVHRQDAFQSVPLNELLLMLLTFVSIVVATGMILAAALQGSRSTSPFRQDAPASKASIPRPSGAPTEARLKAAIRRDEFTLHYQPIVEVDSRRLVGLEALLRWQAPERGLVGPLEFMPVLEESGLILAVGQWVLERVMRTRRDWEALGLRVPRVSVNLSPVQLRQPDFARTINGTVGHGSLIELEITESRLMEDIEANIEKLRHLHDAGIRIAIDDFGTGYSSLAYLARLPVDILKIDRTFVSRMLREDETLAVVQTVMALAQTLKLRTVAEGVEAEEQADMLGLLRCDEMQGYLISRPLPAESVASLLRRAQG